MKDKINQFSPSQEEIENIKKHNLTASLTERICYKCGHNPCPCCTDWCDWMLHNTNLNGNYEDLINDDGFYEVDSQNNIFPPVPCCDGNCTYD